MSREYVQYAPRLEFVDGVEMWVADEKPGLPAFVASRAGDRFEPGRRARESSRGAATSTSLNAAPATGGSANEPSSLANVGTLTFMVGGDLAAFERSKPAFEAMASTIHYVGGLGAGMSAKIVSNFLLDGNVTLVREAIRIAASSGIPESRILEIVTSNKMGSSWVSTNWEQIRAHEDSSWNGKQGVVDMYHKDLQLALDLAQANGVDIPTLRYIVNEVSPTVGEKGLTR